MKNSFFYGFKYWNFKKHIPLSVLTMSLSLIAMTADLLLPLLTADVIDYVIKYEGTTPTGIFSFLLNGDYGAYGSVELFISIATVFMILLLIRIAAIFAKNVTMQWNGLQMENELRHDTYKKLMELDGASITSYNTGELLQILNRDTIIYKELYSRIMLNVFDSISVMLISIVILASMDLYLLIVPVILAPFLLLALKYFLKRSRASFRNVRAKRSELNLAVQENIDAVRLVRSFANESLEEQKFSKHNDALKQASLEQIKLQAKFNSASTAIMQLAYVGTICVSTLLIMNGQLLVGSLAASAGYVMKIVNHISQISQALFHMQNQLVSGGRLEKFLETDSKILSGQMQIPVSQKPHIFEDVSLSLGEKQVLKHIDIDIPYGKRIGIMGGTGSGKSALLKCLSRIFEVNGGKITIDGEDIKNMPLETLRNEYAYVFQDVFLFSNTIDANIAFPRPDCERSEVLAAANIAEADRFVQKLENGYETVVGERGIGLSGGQKQRISIARAILKNSPVLILDDATSALDMATEKRVLSSIKKESGQTIFISAHRVSSVADCDEIIYMRDGEIVERGSFEELISLGGAFAAIYKLQVSDGQLDDSSYDKEED